MDDSPHGLSMTQMSRSIGLSRIVLILGLVFLHYGNFPNSQTTPFEGLDVNEHSFVTWLNSAILFFFFSAVPLLSMISGWLFFSFMAEDAWPSIFRRMRRRFTSLYMPLVVWNLAYLLMIYAAYRMAPHSSAFSHASRINIDFVTAGWKEYINAVFGITGEPLAFQFWFVRDLFVTTLISPALWLIIRHAPWLGTVVMCAIWFCGWDLFIFSDRFDVPFFFFLGALIHQKHFAITVPLKLTITMFAIFIMLAGLRALAPYIVDFSQHAYPFWLNAATRIIRIFGVIGCWGLIYRYAQTKTGGIISNYGGVAFFLHSAHFPLLAIIKVLVWKFVPDDNGFFMMIHYVTSVAITAAIGISAALALAKFAPRVFALMNGGRLLGQSKSGN